MTIPSTLSGLYRATVQDLADPSLQGRVQVILDAYPNDPSLWAMPCVPFAGDGRGLSLLPELGDTVWVAFEGDDTSLPVWLGRFWQASQLPDAPETRFLRTGYGKVTIDDKAGQEKLTIETTDGARIEMANGGIVLEDAAGARIEMANGEVTMKGWPMKFTPPSDAVLARLEALEAAVAQLQTSAV